MALRSLMMLVLLLLLGYNLYVSAARASGQALPKLFGWSTAVIISGSMSGAIEIDDVVVAKEHSGYAVGDVILFRDPNGSTLCHRIIDRAEDGFITKGDANNIPDQQAVPQSGIYGKVRLVLPRVGALQRILRTPLGRILLMLLTAGIVLLPYFQRRKMGNGDSNMSG